MDDGLFRPALRRLVEAVEAEHYLSPPLRKALNAARTTLRTSAPPPECPHCRTGEVRVRFNNAYFHEIDGEVLACGENKR